MGSGHPDQPVAEVAPGAANRHQLHVLGKRVVDLAVASPELALQGRGLDQRRSGERIHLADQVVHALRLEEVLAAADEGPDRRGRTASGQHPSGQESQVAVGQVRILLRPGERELAAQDLGREHEPGVIEAPLAQMGQGAEGVEAGEEWDRKAAAARVEPDRRGPGQDPDPVPGPDWIPVADALHVVPHPIAVDHAAAGGLDYAEHAPVDVRRHAVQELGRRLTQTRRPAVPDQILVAPNAARGDDHGLSPEPELTHRVPAAGRAPHGRARFQDRSLHSLDHPALQREPVDAVPEPQGEEAALDRLAHPPLERRHDSRPGAPGEVKAGHRITVSDRPVATALGPAHDGEEPDPERPQPGPLLARGEGDVSLGPPPRPGILLAVEAG